MSSEKIYNFNFSDVRIFTNYPLLDFIHVAYPFIAQARARPVGRSARFTCAKGQATCSNSGQVRNFKTNHSTFVGRPLTFVNSP